jgi:hypothetical protein
MKHEFDILATLHEIRELLKKQNEILEKQQQQQPQTKITVVGNKAQLTPSKGLKSDEQFTL